MGAVWWHNPKQCLWQGAGGVRGDLEALGAAGGWSGPEHGHCLPGQTQKPAKRLTLTQYPKSFPPQSKLQGKDNAMHA